MPAGSQPQGVLSVAQNPPSCPQKGRSAAPGLKGEVLRQSCTLPHTSVGWQQSRWRARSPPPQRPEARTVTKPLRHWFPAQLTPPPRPPHRPLRPPHCGRQCRAAAHTDLGNLRGLSSSFHGLLGGGGLFAWVVRVLVVGVLVVVRVAFTLSLRVLKADRGHVRKAGPHREPSSSPHRPGSARKSGHQKSRLRTGLCWLQLRGWLRLPHEKRKERTGAQGPFKGN